jgi:hypothetical protein
MGKEYISCRIKFFISLDVVEGRILILLKLNAAHISQFSCELLKGSSEYI